MIFSSQVETYATFETQNGKDIDPNILIKRTCWNGRTNTHANNIYTHTHTHEMDLTVFAFIVSLRCTHGIMLSFENQ